MIKLDVMRRLRVAILFVFCLCLVYRLLFHERRVARSGLWEPMARFRLNDGKMETMDETSRDHGIPRIIHQTWKSLEVPTIFEPWVKSWVKFNPEWDYWFWTDEDMRRFIKEKYPDYLGLYDSYPGVGYRADAFRYFALFEYGGLYADIDMECVRPIQGLADDHACFLSQEPVAHAHFLSPVGVPLVSNALMGCVPGHPFFERVIQALKPHSGLLGWNDVLRATGPYMLTEVYRGYNSGFMTRIGDQEVYLAEPEVFHPSLDNSMVDRMRDMCMNSKGHSFGSQEMDDRQHKLCNEIIAYDFRNKPAANSYSNHHWTHTWAGPRHDPWGVTNINRRFNIRAIKTK